MIGTGVININPGDARQLLPRWIAANAVSEFLGLGLTFLVVGLIFSRLGEPESAGLILFSFLVAVAAGAIEATLVGLAQWWAMHPWFSNLSRSEWWRATLIGALLAYTLGYLPSTVMSLGEAASQEPVTEPPLYLVLLLAAGLGAIGGAVLSFAQWLVLRRHVSRAGLWLPANMLAWSAGMPLIFWGIDLAFRQEALAVSLVLLLAILLLAGAIVGVIHGAFLVRLVPGVTRTRN